MHAKISRFWQNQQILAKSADSGKISKNRRKLATFWSLFGHFPGHISDTV